MGTLNPEYRSVRPLRARTVPAGSSQTFEARMRLPSGADSALVVKRSP